MRPPQRGYTGHSWDPRGRGDAEKQAQNILYWSIADEVTARLCGRERTPNSSVLCCSGDNRLCDARDHVTTVAVDVYVGALVVL